MSASTISSASLGARLWCAFISLVLIAPAYAQEGRRTFCEGSDCVPDSLEIAIEGGDSTLVFEEEFEAGKPINTEVVLDVKTELVKGWSFAVKHDRTKLTISADSVTVEGTIADPAHPDTAVVAPNFEVTQAVDGGFISAVILSFLSPTAQMPLGRAAICRASYTLDGDPGKDGTRLEFVSEEIGAPGSPPTKISLTVGTATKLPQEVVDGIVKVDPPETGDCLAWAVYFGSRTENAHDASGQTSYPILIRNAEAIDSFQLGVQVVEEDGVFVHRVSDALGPDEDRLIAPVLTDPNASARSPRIRNTAVSDLLPQQVLRGAAIQGFDNDFFAVDMDPAVGGTGFTVGFIADFAAADPENVIPATPNVTPPCPLNEILIVSFEEPTGSFLQGDIDGDGTLGLSDGIAGLGDLFLGRPADCRSAMELDGSPGLTVTDMVFLLNHLFLGGDQPPAPYPDCSPSESTEGCPNGSAACN